VRRRFFLTVLFLGLAAVSVQAGESYLSFRFPLDGTTVAGSLRIETYLPDRFGPATTCYFLDLPDPGEIPEDWHTYVLGGSNFRPFSVLWNAEDAEEGRHTLTAVTTLDSGEVFRASITVFVQK